MWYTCTRHTHYKNMSSAPIATGHVYQSDDIDDVYHGEQSSPSELPSSTMSFSDDKMSAPLLENMRSLDTIQQSPRSPIQKYVLDKFQPGSIKGSIFTLISATVGAGMLALPYAFSLVGIVMANIALVVYTVTVLMTFECLMLASKNTGAKSYATLSMVTMGRKASDFTKLVICLNIYGTSVGIMVITKSMLEAIIDALVEHTAHKLYYNEQLLLVVLVLVVVLPLSVLTDIGPLRFTSFIGFCWVLTLTFGVTIYYMIHPHWVSRMPNAHYDMFRPQYIFEANPFLVFVFLAHPNVLPIYLKLQRPSPRRMGKVLHRGIAIAYFVYALSANMVYLTFGSATMPNFILNDYHKNAVLIIGASGFAFSLIVALPLYMHSLRANVFDLLYPRKDPDNGILRKIAIAAVFLSLAVAVPVRSVSSVLGIVGSTTSPVIMFILPCVYVWYLDDHTQHVALRYGMTVTTVVVTVISIVSLALQFKQMATA